MVLKGEQRAACGTEGGTESCMWYRRGNRELHVVLKGEQSAACGTEGGTELHVVLKGEQSSACGTERGTESCMQSSGGET